MPARSLAGTVATWPEQQTLGPWRLSSNDTSSIRSYQCPSHGGDFECSGALENVNVLGEK
ncbi:unnamed protein product, partial [Rangifer tarandus platyrhynchus]